MESESESMSMSPVPAGVEGAGPVDEVADYLQLRCPCLDFSIQNIILRFISAYRDTFSISKKCHFDSLPEAWQDEDKVVDGARMKWCFPLLLDAMSTFLQKESFNLSHRRTFNQHKVLYECIHAELQERHPEAYVRIVSKKGAPKKVDHSLTPIECFPLLASLPQSDFHRSPLIRTHSLPEPWGDVAQLREYILSGPATKSRDKLVNIVSWLCAHPLLAELRFDFCAVMRAVCYKALFRYIQHTIPREVEEGKRQAQGVRRSGRQRKKARAVSFMHLQPLHAPEGILTADAMLSPSPSPCPPSPSTLSFSPHTCSSLASTPSLHSGGASRGLTLFRPIHCESFAYLSPPPPAPAPLRSLLSRSAHLSSYPISLDRPPEEYEGKEGGAMLSPQPRRRGRPRAPPRGGERGGYAAAPNTPMPPLSYSYSLCEQSCDCVHCLETEAWEGGGEMGEGGCWREQERDRERESVLTKRKLICSVEDAIEADQIDCFHSLYSSSSSGDSSHTSTPVLAAHYPPGGYYGYAGDRALSSYSIDLWEIMDCRSEQGEMMQL